MTPPMLATLTALSLLFTAPDVVLAQEAAPEEQSIAAQETPWQVNCAAAEGVEGLSCSMVKSLTINEGKQVLAQAAIVAGAAGEPFVVRILVPHGMALADGLVLSVDDAEFGTATFRTSLAGGAIAVTDLTPELEEAMRNGGKLQIAGTQNNGQALRLEMSLEGFSAALDKLL